MQETQEHRYSIGIDLGTTHCVLSYVDLNDEDAAVTVMPIPQLTNPGNVEERSQLPSFMYQAHESELAPGDTALPWNAQPKAIVGHGGVNRRDAFLPLNSPDEVAKVSPVEATQNYLEHLADAWNNAHPETPIFDQDVTITVPASFDPAARDLTAEAARNVGFKHLTLLEEPQAAVYSWIKNNDETWRDQVSVGDIVLVVDIGGGTTDLSLVAVTEDDGNLTLNRVAVGDHILLGGDNMDLALAYRLKMKLAQEGKQLQPWQVQAITHACRDAKEDLLNDSELKSVPIVVPSRGSKLLGGTLQTELTQEESQAVEELFEKYEQVHDGFIRPTAILFNGGVLKSSLLADRLMSIINSWLTTAGSGRS